MKEQFKNTDYSGTELTLGVIDWTNWNRNRFPELQLIFHIPNGGDMKPLNTKGTAKKLTKT